ncbi:ATP-binding cassette domain-containing protein [Jannaschia sp. CCS1]|uniref:ATP-binding cassette domain-containing protein n=1 Tax=Jannaschia sp. (strain CCS1) TaxID=290400 RepID=UPI000053D13D|nr:ATP-binding cassette domain-containing protein [Jannaschia sp. CCS1]ABD55396.1 monosaccharide ABC transporter membrane protein, CUT2 family [Jannaschia sp. CCS1]
MRTTAQAAHDRVDARLPLEARFGSLSVGQRQLVAICRSLAKDARLVFMDEPGASLIRQEVEHLFRVVRRLKDQGVSIVFVSHRLDEVLEMADRVTVIRDGKKISTMPAADMTEDLLTQHMMGERIEAEFLTSDTGGGASVLEVRDLSRAGAFDGMTLSGGNQQCVVLGKWLATNPRILILDSPTIGVDVKNERSIYEIAQDRARQKVPVIMISDELNELYFNANRIFHTADGQRRAEYRPLEITREAMTDAICAWMAWHHGRGLLVISIFLVALFSALSPYFYSASNATDLLEPYAVTTVLAAGVVVVLISGGLNLAIIATANASTLLMVWLLNGLIWPDVTGAEQIAWIALVFAAGLALCVAIGVINGRLVAIVGVHPILATLEPMTLINGVNPYPTNGGTLSGLRDPVLFISNGPIFHKPLSLFIFLAAAGAVSFLLGQMPLGIRIRIVGSNLNAAWFSGANTSAVLIRST